MTAEDIKAPDKVMKIEKMIGIDSINISTAEVNNE